VENNNPGDQGKEAMKDRSTQLGVRKNPDSPRVHGLRLTVDSASLRFGSQTGNSSESRPSPQSREIWFALRFEHRATSNSRAGLGLR